MHTKRDGTTAHQFLVELSYSFFRPQILKVEPSFTAELTVQIKVLLKSFQLKGDITKAMNFKELLNRPAPANTPDIPTAEEDLLIDCGKSTREEIRKAIKQLKNGKVAGTDGIPAEELKVDPDMLHVTERIYGLFEKIWKEEEINAKWKEELLIKIPKKGDLGLCSKYCTESS